MTAKNLATVANELIESYGNTVHNVIGAYRAGGERMVDFLEQRWEQALEQSRPQLTAEVAENASAAQKVFGGYYAKTLSFTTDGADSVLDQLVKLASTGVERAAANASLFEEKTGVTTLNLLASAAVPAAQAVRKIAAQIEQKSADLVGKIAGADVTDATPERVSPFKKARAAKAA